jgi:KipI family sensor histidine kinase inhibitor
LALARRLNQIDLDGVIECVPTFRSLMVHYDPLVVDTSALSLRIGELMRGLHVREDVGRVWRLPACYDPSIAPDLDQVAGRTGLSAAQVVECHSATSYHVYMLGFLPGMAYLGDVPGELVLPRLATPRLKVPAGSLGIATTMTCVYPMDTPAGWHLIGRCPVPFLERRAQPTVLLGAGDKVTFTPVSLREYEQMSAQAAAGTLRIVPVEEPMEVAA